MGTSAQIRMGAHVFADVAKLIFYPPYLTPAPIFNDDGAFGTYKFLQTGPITSTWVNPPTDLQTGNTPGSNAMMWVASFGDQLKRIPQESDISGPSALRPPAGPPQKGICPIDIFAVYGVTSGAITSAYIRLVLTWFYDQKKGSLLNVPLDQAVSFPLVHTGPVGENTLNVVTVPVLNPKFITDNYLTLSASLVFTLASAVSINFYGIGMHFDYNFT